MEGGIEILSTYISYLEIFATIFTLICVALTVKANVWAWPIGLVGVTAYFFIFYQAKLYADMGLQVVFFMQGIYGWYYWLYGKGSEEEEVPIRVLSDQERLIGGAILVAIVLLLGSLLSSYTDADAPYVDAALAATSLVANMLLARKILDNWVLWVVADVVYVGLFYYKELYLTSVLYVIFFFMASNGLIQWRKKWRQQEV